VFRSWAGDRAVAYRRREGIADDLGTAVNVQAMVFGNRDDRLGHRRVGFTRDPGTGRPVPTATASSRLGEDVVAGIGRRALDAMATHFGGPRRAPRAFGRPPSATTATCGDVEFTSSRSACGWLQVRDVGKRGGGRSGADGS
jgi:pyruvate,orthophosphate dikinase